MTQQQVEDILRGEGLIERAESNHTTEEKQAAKQAIEEATSQPN